MVNFGWASARCWEADGQIVVFLSMNWDTAQYKNGFGKRSNGGKEMSLLTLWGSQPMKVAHTSHWAFSERFPERAGPEDQRQVPHHSVLPAQLHSPSRPSILPALQSPDKEYSDELLVRGYS